MFNTQDINNIEVVLLGKVEQDIEKEIIERFVLVDLFDELSFSVVERLVKLKKQNKNCLFIVFGTRIETEKWGNMLAAYGFKYWDDFVDYISFKYYTSLLESKTHKRLVLFYGNCQMHDYYDCLNRCPDFISKFDSVYFKYEEYPSWKEEQFEKLINFASVVIYTIESFDKKHRDIEKIIYNSNSKCKQIRILCFSFRGLFPQTNPHIQGEIEFDIIQELFNTFHREDLIINSMIKHECSTQEIVNQYYSGLTFSTEHIRKLFEVSLKQLSIMDKKSDVKIYDYVKNNITKYRLFKDPVHMEDLLIWYIAREILSLLKCDAPKENIGGTIHYFSELPIYPEVASALKLEWWNSETKCQLRLAEGMLLVTPQQYISRYCNFCKNVYQIKNSLHITENDHNSILELFNL